MNDPVLNGRAESRRSFQEVFIPGGMPRATYVRRKGGALERALALEIKERYKAVCVIGPSKSGKTTLCRRVLGDAAVWLEGGQAASSSQMWALLADLLSVKLAEIRPDWGFSPNRALESREKRLLLDVAHEAGVCIVMDDFHLIPHAVQAEWIRFIKPKIFEGFFFSYGFYRRDLGKEHWWVRWPTWRIG